MQETKANGHELFGYYGSQAPPAKEPWSVGFFDCFSDLKTFCTAFWCPCITFGRVAEIVDQGAVSCGASGALHTLIIFLFVFPCYYSCFYRINMRRQYNLKGCCCGDCLLHCFCEACALTQEYRELRNRGFDMSLGWHGNVERQNQVKATAPPVEKGMTK